MRVKREPYMQRPYWAGARHSAESAQKKVASVESFLAARTVAAVNEEDWTSASVLEAHYSRWAFKRELGVVDRQAFIRCVVAACDKIVTCNPPLPTGGGAKPAGCGVGVQVNGHLLYPLALLDVAGEGATEPVRVTDAAASAEPVVRGRVRVLRALKFADGDLPDGNVLDSVVPTKNEQEVLRRMSSKDSSENWLVVVFAGRRRYIPGNAVEKV